VRTNTALPPTASIKRTVLAFGLVQIAERDRRPFAIEGHGGRASDAAAGARDEHRFAVKSPFPVIHDVLLYIRRFMDMDHASLS